MRKYICLLPWERKKLDSSLNLLTKSFLGVHCTGVLLKKGKRKPQVTCYWRSMFYHWYCIPIIGWSIDTLYVKEQRSPRLDDTHATVRYKVLMSLKKNKYIFIGFHFNPFHSCRSEAHNTFQQGNLALISSDNTSWE